MNQLTIIPLTEIGAITEQSDLAEEITNSLAKQNLKPMVGDIFVVTQKVVSKVEGALVDLRKVTPSACAKTLAENGKKSAAYYEVVLQQSKRIVRSGHGVLICETHHGFICANAGVDESNVKGKDIVSLLPKDSDASAQKILTGLQKQGNIKNLAVIISDTWGRAWREGQVNMAIGVAGIDPLVSYQGLKDQTGYTLEATVIAIADELAGAGELVMNKLDNVPVALIRGYAFKPAKGNIKHILRDPKMDLFR